MKSDNRANDMNSSWFGLNLLQNIWLTLLNSKKLFLKELIRNQLFFPWNILRRTLSYLFSAKIFSHWKPKEIWCSFSIFSNKKTTFSQKLIFLITFVIGSKSHFPSKMCFSWHFSNHFCFEYLITTVSGCPSWPWP